MPRPATFPLTHLAEQDYRAEAFDRYEVAAGSVDADLAKLEAFAELVMKFEREASALIRGLEFADPRMTPVDYSDRDRCEMILETMDDLMSGEAQRVVSAHVAKAFAAEMKEAA